MYTLLQKCSLMYIVFVILKIYPSTVCIEDFVFIIVLDIRFNHCFLLLYCVPSFIAYLRNGCYGCY